MMPKGLKRQFQEVYGIDVAKYTIDWTSIVTPYVQNINDDSTWDNAFLLSVLSQHAQTIKPGVEDDCLELITQIILYNLKRNKEDTKTITPGVFESLALLTRDGKVDIPKKYWIPLQPTLVDYISKNISNFNTDSLQNLFEKLYYLPLIWPHLTENTWTYTTSTYKTRPLNERYITSRLMVVAAPSKYATVEIFKDGLMPVLLDTNNTLIPIADLKNKMKTSSRPLALWSQWLTHSNPNDLPHSKITHYVKLAKVLTTHSFDLRHRDTWHVWAVLDKWEKQYHDTEVALIIKEVRTNNPAIQNHYTNYEPIVSSIASSNADISICLLESYIAGYNKNIETPIMDNTIFTSEP